MSTISAEAMAIRKPVSTDGRNKPIILFSAGELTLRSLLLIIKDNGFVISDARIMEKNSPIQKH
jgi:hypothetical protein